MAHTIGRETDLGEPISEIYYSTLNGDTVCTIIARTMEAAMVAQKGATAPIVFTLITDSNLLWLGNDVYYEPTN